MVLEDIVKDRLVWKRGEEWVSSKAGTGIVAGSKTDGLCLHSQTRNKCSYA